MVLKSLNTIALTLLVALTSLVLTMLLGRLLPGLFDPTVERVTVAAWLSCLGGWWMAGLVRRQHRAKGDQAQKASPRAVGFTVAFLACATLAVLALHFFGDRLWP